MLLERERTEVVGPHVMLVALGIDSDGQMHVLGVREGATENAATCTALLTIFATGACTPNAACSR